MDRTERFYKIQAMLMAKQSVSMKQMQEALEVSRATLNRDLAYMRDRLGIPFAWDASLRGYALIRQQSNDKTFELPGIWFNQQEIVSLLTMIELISKLEPGGLLHPQLAPFKQRLESLLEDGIGNSAEARNRIRILPMAQRHVSGDYFQLVTYALVQRKRVTMQHFARPTGQTTEREISPQRLVYYRDNWYVDAYCHLRESLRSFSLDAINNVTLLEQKAIDIPEEQLRETFESSYGIFTGKNRQVAKLKFTPFRAQWVAREIWHPEQVGEVHADGSYTLEVPYGEDWELLQDILRQGPDVEVLGPLELRHKVMKLIDQLSGIYR
ncbi:WYL domain-containing protein [Orrella sp. NBD-18]|uniref:WYL domain-containing protein n=1 Tax=Sheuella amnicola TaxID=2707330 RepID=A0A6B2R2W9_9BURK|nr:WYL domain-containing protein [Sheuella amnicola]NDY84453.1 WYL domain-containing protein [Sheuella amnicola]